MSEKLSNLKFFLTILVVPIHCVTYFAHVPGLGLRMVYGKNISTFVQLIVAQGISRIAVPFFALISGYLFYLTYDGSKKCYFRKMKNRFFSIVVPYLLWSGGFFVLFVVAQRFLGLGEMFSTRNDEMMGISTIVWNVILEPYDFPLWYLQYIWLLVFMSPILFFCLKKNIILAFSLWGGCFTDRGYYGLALVCDCCIWYRINIWDL